MPFRVTRVSTSRAGRNARCLLHAAVLLAALDVPALAGAARESDAGRRIVNVNHEALAGSTLTVVTFNMLHGFGSRVNDATLEDRLVLLADGIETLLPDVVLLQEASLTPGRHGNAAERLRDMLNQRMADRGVTYNSVFHMANGSGLVGFFEGPAILSRGRIRSADVLAYGAQAVIPPEHRIALRARIEAAPSEGVPGGRFVDVVSTHLTNTDARCRGVLVRTFQARELVRWLDPGAAAQTAALVVGGDFNDVPGSATIHALTDAGLRDAWVEAGALGPGLTSIGGALRDPFARAVQRIDYIFVRGASVQAARLFLDSPGCGADGGTLWASDHLGVCAVIGLP